MPRYRLSEPAKADIAAILRRSADLHGREACNRYRGALAAAMRRAATQPEAVPSLDRAALAPGLRSLHLRHVRTESREVAVAAPVHVLFYRRVAAGLIEIVRVLHERMDPSRHLPPPILPP